MSGTAEVCIVCGSDELSLVFAQDPSISTDRRVLPVSTRTVACGHCGFVFNAGGARDREGEFYAEQYELHGESAVSEWQVFVEGQSQGENDAILALRLRLDLTTDTITESWKQKRS